MRELKDVSNTTTPIRTFIAVELPQELRDLLSQAQESLRTALGSAERAVKWVHPEGIHLTLQFLGDVPTTQIDAIREALARACSGAKRTELHVSDLGVFPNLRRPRVVWVGLEGGLEPLHALERAIERELRPLGFLPDKPFNPHLTLGRIREHARPDEMAAITNLLSKPTTHQVPPYSFTVYSVSLMKSDLHPTGAVYTRLADVELG